jgi:hypothetical protein
MKRLTVLAIFALINCSLSGQISGTFSIPGDYPNIDSAFRALNTNGIGNSGVTFNVAAGYSETTTDSLYLTASGKLSGPVVFQKYGTGTNPLITRSDGGRLTTGILGAQGDAVIILNGCDYVTFNGIDVTAGSAGIEYGYYLIKSGSTDGCKNVTIKNSAITLNRGTNGFVAGIYVSNNAITTTVSNPTGIAVITGTGGRNENVTLTGNTIRNVATGILLRGYNHTSPPYDFCDLNFVVGTPGEGNTITNFASNAATALASHGILIENHCNPNVSYNTINNTANGGVNASAILYGIYFPAADNPSTYLSGGNATFNNNFITLGQGSTAAAHCIYTNQLCNSITVSGNSFSYGSFASTAASYLIFANSKTANVTATYNTTSGAISKTGSSGNFICYYNQGSGTGGTEIVANNTFSQITLSGSSVFTGIHSTNTGVAQNKEIYGNTVSNITSATGAFTGLNVSFGTTVNIYQNLVHTIVSTGSQTGILAGWKPAGSGETITYNTFDNTIYGFTTTGTGARITGIDATSSTTPVNIDYHNIYKNRIYNLTSTGASNTTWGIGGQRVVNLRIYNNMLSDLKAPAASGINAVQGINIQAVVTNAFIFYNTIFLNASSSSTLFGTSALMVNSAVVLDLRNNILVNKSNHKGNTGYTVAFRRNGISTPSNYLAISNSNDLFSSSSASILNYLYYDGTNKDSTISMFKARVAPSDAASFSEEPPFVNTGTAPYDLHLQAVATKCESSAITISSPVSVIEDIDGLPRYPTPGYPNNPLAPAEGPDVGADEFAGTAIFTCIMPVPGNTITSGNNLCKGDQITLSLQNPSNGSGNQHQWQQSTDGIVYSDIANATLVPYTFTPFFPAFYRCQVTCQAGLLTGWSNPIQITFSHEVTSATPASRCGSGNLQLEAAGSAGTQLAWYEEETYGPPVGSGSPFTTPTIDTTTIYYVAAETSGQEERVVGAGNLTSNNPSNPLYGTRSNSRTRHLITAGELYNAGLSSGNLTALGMYITNAFSLPVKELTIKLGQTGADSLIEFEPIPLTVVYSTASMMPVSGLNKWFFSTPFFWDGYSNLVVEFCHGDPVNAAQMLRTCRSNSTAYLSTINSCFANQAVSGEVVCDTVISIQITTYHNRPQFYLTGNKVCSSPRVAVQATVVPPPPFEISDDMTLCSDDAVSLTVLSDTTLYDEYLWSPLNGLFTDPNGTIPYTGGSATTVYVKIAVEGTYTYTCHSLENNTLCSDEEQVTITVLPLHPQISAVPPSLCISGSSMLTVTLSGGSGTATFQWQQSTDGINFSDIPGMTGLSYQTPYIGQTTWYRLVIRKDQGNICSMAEYELSISNPLITGTIPGFHCGPGTVVLQATGTTGQITWYDSPSGGSPVGSGSPFTTPYLWSSKTFYVSAVEPGTILEPAGRPSPLSLENGTMSNHGLVFNAHENIRLQSVDIYPVLDAGEVGVSLYDQNLNLVAGPVFFMYPGGDGSTPHTLPVDFQISQGNGYRLILTTVSYNGNLLRETSSGASWGIAMPFPISRGSLVTLTGAVSSLAGIPETSSYNWFYNWRIMKGCASPLIPVEATINLAPFYELTEEQSVCNNIPAKVQVINGTSYFNRFIWSPATYLFTDAACTIPYTTGTNTPVVYMKSTLPGNYEIRGYANNTINGCTNFDTTHVVILPPLISIHADPDSICVSGMVNLSILPSMNYGSSGIQWQVSTDNINFSDIQGATNQTYTSEALTTATWYRVTISNSEFVQCLSATTAVYVDSPDIIATTPGSRCGTGSVTLGATAKPGNLIRWYQSALSGAILGEGSLFTTPSITETMNFYVAATGSSGATTSLGPPEKGSATTSSSEGGLAFNVEAASILLEGVHIYPVGTGEGSVTISLKTSTGQTLETVTAICTGTASPGIKTFIPLHWSVNAGLGYFLDMTGCSGLVTSLVRDNSGNIQGGAIHVNPYCYVPGVAMITMGQTAGGPSTVYYYFYDWHVKPECSTVRIPVLATINPSNPVNITPDRTVCMHTIHTLSVTSNISDYDSYTWSPADYLYADAGCTIPYIPMNSATTVYFRSGTAGSTVYTCHANNSINLCNSTSQTAVTVVPEPVVTSLPAEICYSGNTILNLNPASGYGLAGFQWQSSPDNLVFTDIPGATNQTYTTPVLTSGHYYKNLISDATGQVCAQPTYSVIVNDPQLLSTMAGARCNPGSVSLGASVNPGTSVNWYAGPSGGVPLGTGTTFSTPVISATTSYFAAATAGTVTTMTVPSPAPGSTGNFNTSTGWGLHFTVNTPININSVRMFPKNTNPGPATLQVLITDLSDVVVASGPVYNFSVGTTFSEVTVPVYATLLPGNYKMVMNSTGINLLLRENSGIAYPYVSSGGEVAITAGANGLGTAQTSLVWFWFYHWTISIGCESPRQEVLASVNVPPDLTVSSGKSVCTGEIYPIQVTSAPELFETYTWAPEENLFTDPACTVPYSTLANTLSVYFKAGQGGTTTYTCTGTNTSGAMCSNSDSVTITVIPQATISALPQAICFSGNATLSLNPGSGYGTATFQWYDSPDNVVFSELTGATGNIYITPVLSSSHYYKVTVRNESGLTCSEPTYTLTVETPQVLTTLPGTRCGIGSVELGATASSGILYWYDTSTGGVALGSGNSFLTPVIQGTTQFYVESVSGGCQSPRVSVLATVTPPPAIFVQALPSQVCSGASSLLTVTSTNSSYIYSWIPENLSGISNWVAPDTTTTYIVTATDPVTGCVTTGTVMVEVLPIPSQVFITPSSPVINLGDIQILTASGGTLPGSQITFSWIPYTDLYLDPQGIIQYNGENQITVYAQPSVTTVYTAISTISSTGCSRAQDVAVTVLSTCQMPENVASSGISYNQVTLTWSEPGSAPGNGYEYEIRLSGAPGSGSNGLAHTGTTAAGVTTTQVTGLSAQTTYHVYVRSNCGDNLYSGWTPDHSFITLPEVPEFRTVENVLVGSGQIQCYDATNTITVAGNGTTFFVENGGTVYFTAGLKISYLPGTSVVSGGRMTGKITPTGPWCMGSR